MGLSSVVGNLETGVLDSAPEIVILLIFAHAFRNVDRSGVLDDAIVLVNTDLKLRLV